MIIRIGDVHILASQMLLQVLYRHVVSLEFPLECANVHPINKSLICLAATYERLCITRVHTYLEKSLILTFDLKSHWIWYWPGKLTQVIENQCKSLKKNQFHEFMFFIVPECSKFPHFFLGETPFLQLHACSDLRSLQAWSCKKGFQISG